MKSWRQKLLLGMAALVMTTLIPFGSVDAASEIRVLIDNKKLATDVPPYIENNITMLPFRAIGEALGASVEWKPQEKRVEFSKEDKLIQLTIGESKAIVNGQSVSLDQGAKSKSGRTMVPLRFIGESLGVQVNWEKETRTVRVVTGEEQQHLQDVRGAWISTVYNIDWPSDPKKGFDAEKQKQEYTALLDNLKEMGLNAVYVQIRPTADSFYPSKLFPWSQWLTGTQGKDPGYDPLAFMIEETHKRGMEFHAWFNPYRVSVQNDITKLSADHPARKNPDWVVKNGNLLLFDPGKPEARDYILKGIMEVVTNYDIDGIHFDDYFYPYGTIPFEDEATYKEYNKVFSNKADWRRNNVNLFVQQVEKSVHAVKPEVQFGISPFGVWRNASVDPTGSNTKAGITSYDSLYADVRKWIQNGWIDYVMPQVYWHIGHSAADYKTVVDWWLKETEGTGVELYIGHAAYKLADPNEKDWATADTLIKELDYIKQYDQISGAIFFSAKDLVKNTKQVGDRLKEYYTK
ncbi:family 10 glycosylhydrolase [Paenibacillus sp. 1001270B_150601_E10]|uniref:family 10 glycosylhydrolase n=1 Tax=Paenibacillus sp. 1001270B_150601_E10 TaxID=2787079 RepID=UPI0018A07E1B|nr:family 10 glycosylhydrolase [Paenibacillus sp. 1001270B_150601_E10]